MVGMYIRKKSNYHYDQQWKEWQKIVIEHEYSYESEKGLYFSKRPHLKDRNEIISEEMLTSKLGKLMWS